MSFTVDNFNANKITLTNEHVSDPLLYTIHVLGNNNEFEAVDTYPDTPTTSLDPDTSVVIDLVNDGIYKFITSDGESYFFLDKDLRSCEKNYLQKVLCRTCDPCDEMDIPYMRDLLRFYSLRDRFYYIANKYYQDQSTVDFIDPDDSEVFYWSDLLSQLSKICDNCYQSSHSSPNEDCGCH